VSLGFQLCRRELETLGEQKRWSEARCCERSAKVLRFAQDDNLIIK
jgi:hypothetical protein